MADPFGDQAQNGANKRPAQTIEGTATEVSVEPAPGAEARGEAEPSSDRSDDPSRSGEESGTADAPPPPRTSVAELKSFMTHMAAGLLGGLMGVVGLAIAWGALDLGKESAPAPNTSALEARVAKLEAAPASGDAEAVSQLESRIASLEGSAKEAPLSDLTNRVAQLETSLKSLAETAQEGGSVASAAAISQQIAEAEQRLDAKIAEALAKGEGANAATISQMQSELAELKAKIGALAEAELGTGGSADLGPELTALSGRIAKLETTLPDVTAALAKESAGAKSAALAIAFANLRAAVSDGRPFAAELDTIGALAPSDTDLGILPAYAEKGIPTVPELARFFAAARDGAGATSAAPPSSDSLMGSLMASAESLVKIKRLDRPAAGEGPGAALARAGAALDKGDLPAAVKEVETLEGAKRDAFSVWLGQARARLQADEILTRLEGTLLVSIGGDAQGAQE